MQAMFIYLPSTRRLFGTTPIEAGTWLRIVAFGTAMFAVVAMEAILASALSAVAQTSSVCDVNESDFPFLAAFTVVRRALLVTYRALVVAYYAVAG